MNINCIDSEWNKPHIPGFFQRILPFPLPSQSDPSPHFSVTFDNSSVLRRGALGSAVTLNPLILHRGSSAQERASKWNYGDAFGGLTRMYEIPPSSVPHWWIVHASHHTSHAAAYVMSATRGEAYARTRVYVDVFISSLGLKELWLILIALYFYPTFCPPTHHLFLRRTGSCKKERKKKYISSEFPICSVMLKYHCSLIRVRAETSSFQINLISQTVTEMTLRWKL